MNPYVFRHYPYIEQSQFIVPHDFYKFNNTIPYVYPTFFRSESYPYTITTDWHPSFHYSCTQPGICTVQSNIYPFLNSTEGNPYKSFQGDNRITFAEIVVIAEGIGKISEAIVKVKQAINVLNPAVSGVINIHNHTDITLRKVRESLQHGGYAITPTGEIPPKSVLVFGVMNSEGSIMTGAEGSITYAGDGVEMTVHWDIPFAGGNNCNIILTGPNSSKYITYKACGAGSDNADMRYELHQLPFPVFGAIRVKWLQLRHILGDPLDAEKPTFDGIGRFQPFKGGLISWHPETGAHVVWGAILARWLQIGREQFGYPITDELTTSDGRGRYNHFRTIHVPGKPESSIYWSPQTGAQEIYGGIRARWAQLGWEKSRLGYPIGPEHNDPSGGSGARVQSFEKGWITWTPRAGAKEGYHTSPVEWPQFPGGLF